MEKITDTSSPRPYWLLVSAGATLAFVLFVFAVAWVMLRQAQQAPSTVSDQPSADTTVASPTNPAAARRSAAAPLLSYEDALDQYRDRLLQVDNCVANPTYQTVKNKTALLLDNRSPDGLEIHLDDTVYRLGGYEFQVVTIQSTALPHTIQVDCLFGDRTQFNMAQILVQQ